MSECTMKKSTRFLSIPVPSDVKQRLRDDAVLRGISLSDLVREIIGRYRNRKAKSCPAK